MVFIDDWQETHCRGLNRLTFVLFENRHTVSTVAFVSGP